MISTNFATASGNLYLIFTRQLQTIFGYISALHVPETSTISNNLRKKDKRARKHEIKVRQKYFNKLTKYLIRYIKVKNFRMLWVLNLASRCQKDETDLTTFVFDNVHTLTQHKSRVRLSTIITGKWRGKFSA